MYKNFLFFRSDCSFYNHCIFYYYYYYYFFFYIYIKFIFFFFFIINIYSLLSSLAHVYSLYSVFSISSSFLLLLQFLLLYQKDENSIKMELSYPFQSLKIFKKPFLNDFIKYNSIKFVPFFSAIFRILSIIYNT